jgi:hypothetical protein
MRRAMPLPQLGAFVIDKRESECTVESSPSSSRGLNGGP